MKRRREWTLSSRDLPDPSVIKDEPLLADLENNAAYRMLTYRTDRMGSLAGESWVGRSMSRLLWILVVCVIAFVGGWIAAAVIILVLAVYRITRPSSLEPGGRFLLGFDRQRFADLHQTGYEAEAILAGVWGTFLPRGKKSSEFVKEPLFLIPLLLLAFFFLDWGWLWIGVFFAFAIGYEFAKRRYLPCILLPRARKTLEQAALAASGAFTGCAGLIVGGYVMIQISILLMMLISVVLATGEGNFEAMMEFLQLRSTIFLATVISFLVGMFAGDRRGLGCRKDRAFWLLSMKPHLDGLIERAGEEKPSV